MARKSCFLTICNDKFDAWATLMFHSWTPILPLCVAGIDNFRKLLRRRRNSITNNTRCIICNSASLYFKVERLQRFSSAIRGLLLLRTIATEMVTAFVVIRRLGSSRATILLKKTYDRLTYISGQ